MQRDQNIAEPHPKYLLAGVCVCVCVCALNIIWSGVEMKKIKENDIGRHRESNPGHTAEIHI